VKHSQGRGLGHFKSATLAPYPFCTSFVPSEPIVRVAC